MIALLLQGQVMLFTLILVAIIISLTFHEFGHAAMARLYGDDTAQRAGRLTLNPAAHIDPLGLLMVATVGFGFAKPVPTNPSRFTSVWGDFFVSAAGPGMNLLLAVVAVNLYVLGQQQGWALVQGEAAQLFFTYFSLINLILMVFNLIPLGSLDGHYILPYFLPRRAAQAYRYWNDRYGNQFFMVLIVLSLVGVPVFRVIWNFGQALLPWIVFV